MSNTASLYWLTRLDHIQSFLIAITIISSIAFVSIIIGCAMHADMDDYSWNKDKEQDREKSRAKWKGFLKPLGFIAGLFSLVLVFLPTRDEAIFIVAGGKTIDFIQQDSSINKIPSQTTKAISVFLDNQIKELEGDTTK